MFCPFVTGSLILLARYLTNRWNFYETLESNHQMQLQLNNHWKTQKGNLLLSFIGQKKDYFVPSLLVFTHESLSRTRARWPRPLQHVQCGSTAEQRWQQQGPPSVSADKYSQPAVPGMDVGCSETWQCDIILSTLVFLQQVGRARRVVWTQTAASVLQSVLPVSYQPNS